MIFEETQKSIDLNMFTKLKSNKSNFTLLNEFRQQEKNDQIIQKKLIKIIKQSAFYNGIEHISGRAMTILKKITKTISWENFSNIHLKDCSMRGISFIECNFFQSKLENVIIDSCWFIGCCLDRVNWSNITSSEQKIIKLDDSYIHSIVNSTDGTLLISTVEKQKSFGIKIDNFQSGNNLKMLSTPSNISVQVISLTKQIIAYTIHQGKQLIIQNILNGKFIIKKFSNHHLTHLFHSNNGIMMIDSEISKKIIVYQCINSKILRKIHHKINLPTVSQFGQYFSYLHNDAIEVCDVTRARTHILKNEITKKIDYLFFTQNNQEIAAKCYNKIYFWNLNLLKLKKKIKLIYSKEAELLACRNHPLPKDGQVIVTYNKPNFTFYDTQTKLLPRRIRVLQEVQSFVFHSIQPIMIVACQKNYIFYINYMAKQKTFMKKTQDSSFNQFALSYNAEFIASCYKNKLQILKVKNGEEFKCPEIKGVTSITFSPYNNMLIIEKNDSSLSLYDIKKQEECKQIQLNQKYGWIKNITFSTTGTLMALTFSFIDQIVVFDGKTLTQLFVLKGHSHSIRLIQFSPNGQLLASESEGKIIRLWNIEQLNQCIIIELVSQKNISFAFSLDNKLFVYAISFEKLIFLDIQLNREVKSIQYLKDLQHIKFFNDGLSLLCCTFKGLEILEIETGNILHFYNSYNYTNFFQFLFDGKILAQGSSDGIKLWDVYYVKSYQILGKLHELPITSLAFSHENQILISGTTEGMVGIYDCSKSKKLEIIKGVPEVSNITLIHQSKSGMYLALVGQNLIIHLWNLKTLQMQNKFAIQKKKILSIDIQDNDKQLLSCDENKIYLWDIASRLVFKTFNNHFSLVNQVFFSLKENEIYVSNSEHISVVNFREEGNIQILQHPNIITVLKMSLNRNFFVLGSVEGQIYLFDLISKKITRELYEHDDQIVDINFSPDDNVFASVSKDDTICFWKLKFDIIFEKVKYIKGVNSISFLSQGTLACGCKDGTVKTIQFVRQSIRPLNEYSKNPKLISGQNSTLNDAKIISTQGFNLVEVLKNSI